jgi:YidC/Oxa1 family membrane protein insertase
MSELWNLLFYRPILNSLIFLYKTLGSNFGLAIISLTLLTRAALVPLILPALRSARVLQDLQPELDGLKKKYKKDKRRFQEEQLKLYRERGVNPAGGCLPYLLQFLILIALYRVFIHFIQTGMIDDTQVQMDFLWLNLAKPDPFYILPILAGVSQFALAKMMGSKRAAKPPKETDDMAVAMQRQMIFVMPVMTVLIATRLPSGLALYWLTTTFFSIGQQYFLAESRRLDSDEKN